MSLKHLATGSAQPPRIEGKLRLYSMQFCPYAERARLVLLKKKIPHDVVNVNLKTKPEWLFTLNTKGLVPVLDTGTDIISESLAICDYLEEKYPGDPLYPETEEDRAKDKEIVNVCDNLMILHYKAVRNPDNETLDEHLARMKPLLVRLEQELQTRGLFFGGDSPKMADYMIWPLGERAQMLKLCFGQDLPGKDKYPCLYRWCEKMRTLEEVKDTITSVDRLYNLSVAYKNTPNNVDYDSI